MWFSLIKQYWNVGLFKQTPAQTPYSPLLLGIVWLFYCLLVVCQWLLSDIDNRLTLALAALIAGALGASYVLYTGALLFMFHKGTRIVQTLTSLLATHAIIHLFTLPLLLLTPLLIESNTVQTLAPFVGIVYLILTLFLTIWQVSIAAYIYKHALAIDLFPAFLASLGLLACNILVVSFLW